MVQPVGWLYRPVYGLVRWENIIPHIIVKGLPEYNGIGTVFSKIFLQSKIFLIVAVASGTERKDPVSRVASPEMLFKRFFGHHVRRTCYRLDLGIAEKDNYDIGV